MALIAGVTFNRNTLPEFVLKMSEIDNSLFCSKQTDVYINSINLVKFQTFAVVHCDKMIFFLGNYPASGNYPKRRSFY